MASFVDINGQRQQVNLTEKGVMYHYDMAAQEKLTLRQWINSQYPTQAGAPDAFSQMCAASGLRFKKDENLGIPSANLREILDPMAANQTGGVNTNFPQVPDSRLLFPAAIMEAVNADIESKENEAMGVFAQLIAFTDTIASDRWEQPIISTDGKKGPEDSGFRRVAQNAPPPIMLSITAADYTRTIATKSIGLSVSHKALQFNSLDLVARTMTHFYKKADFSEWLAWFLLLLNGDTDGVNTPMATVKSALAQVKAVTLDSTIAAAGVLSQDAWTSYIHSKSMTMVPNYIVTDFAGAKAIDNRTGRPTVLHDSASMLDRIDAPMELVFPKMSSVKVIALPPDSGWTANTLMGIDNKQAIGKVVSSTANYEAVSDLLMLRSMQFRFDRGSLIYRYLDDAFSVLSLTL